MPCAAPSSARCCCCCCCPAGAASPLARCAAASWHCVSLVFAEHPLRQHRAWLGAVPPPSASEAVIGRGAEQQQMGGGGGGGGGGGKKGSGFGGCFDAGLGAKRRLPFACINPVPAAGQPKKCAASARSVCRERVLCVFQLQLEACMTHNSHSLLSNLPMPNPDRIGLPCRQGLEELYAANRKRRQLVYALRRRHSDRCLLPAGCAGTRLVSCMLSSTLKSC